VRTVSTPFYDVRAIDIFSIIFSFGMCIDSSSQHGGDIIPFAREGMEFSGLLLWSWRGSARVP
jgi:hypothetical protein